MIDTDILEQAAARLRPGSKAYDIRTPAGVARLSADRQIATSALEAIIGILDKIDREDRRSRYTDIEETVTKSFDAARDAFPSEHDAPEQTPVETAEQAAALRAEANRTVPYDVTWDGVSEQRHRYVHDRRARRILLAEADRIDPR